MISTSDSFSETAVDKASSKTSEAAKDSKFETRKVLEGRDDSLSPDSGTNEATRKVDMINLPCSSVSTEKNDDMEVKMNQTDEIDDSDMVEEDVKVCDICGDAGREDLLAICCRCSDGAEHTYCMRKMLTAVPEGDWLCEECETADRMKNQRQNNKIRKMDENEKNNNSSGLASSDCVNSSDVENNRTKGRSKNLGKRPRDDVEAEVSSIVKKPAFESIIGSPKPAGPSKISRENSFKNPNKGKVHVPISDSVNETPKLARAASDPKMQSFRGTFSKSNSFTSLNSKPKGKLVDRILQRQKSVKELSPLRLKEGGIRNIGKSMSFKSTDSMRSDSKIKMLSPRMSDIKNTKQRSTFERQSSFKSELTDKKITSGNEPSSLSTSRNHHETKFDGKLLSRSSSFAARKSPEFSSSLGEFKRGGNSTTPANGINHIDRRSNHSTSKEDSSCEKPLSNASEGLPDESSKESSGTRFRPPHVKSLRDEPNTLKAAIEAAVLRKPGGYRKHSEAAFHDQSSTLYGKRIESLKQFEAVSSGENGVRVAPLAPMPFSLNSLAVPQHEYIWQGSFEIYRSGKTSVLWDGIQAHLSTVTSPKVIESVSKFKSRMVFHEVPRLSTWPVQFQEHGVGEENIAIFFFAKDLYSYDKIYKVWVENMMKNDLALKGNLNGIDLLIFPSNQLPENSQRWNMLFFLWGVFRGKKEPESLKPFSGSRDDLPRPIMSLPENRCSLSDPKVHASEELLSSRSGNGDCGMKIRSLDWLDSRIDSKKLGDARLEGGINNSGCKLSGREQIVIQVQQLSLEEGKSETSALHNIPRVQDQVPLIMDAGDISKDINTDQGSRWICPESTCKAPPPVAYAASISQVLSKNDDTCYETPLEKMNHVDSDEIVIPENPERRFFPTELHPPPLKGIIPPWKMHPLEQQNHLLHDNNNNVPNLELALGAESKELDLGIKPLLGWEKERKITPDESYILDDTSAIDASASLSLSLAFPFPEDEKTTERSPKKEQFDHRVNNSMLLFRKLGDK